MMIDASAIVAILKAEPDGRAFADAIDGATTRLTPPIAICEATVALMRENRWSSEQAGAIIKGFLDEASIEVMTIDRDVAVRAVEAFERFGKGRHPEQLNMGDCFSYVCAQMHDLPLLYKGNDFSRTDIETAFGR
ncbi:MAG: type II toxin-antitoxin system VapC family toxin [Alphaproteobacteria bacterium]|nr:type II toxin-antitoxin system VapC family toxin [Alphaproteobacteria bacterium]